MSDVQVANDMLYYRCVEVVDMAKILGIELWGYAPDGTIRCGHKGDAQPSFIMTDVAIKDKFISQYNVIPVKPHSCYMKVVEKEPVEVVVDAQACLFGQDSEDL